MKKLLTIIALSLFLNGNTFGAELGPINKWIAKGYKVKNEDFMEGRRMKIFTLQNRLGFIVICTVEIKVSGSIRTARCKEQ